MYMCIVLQVSIFTVDVKSGTFMYQSGRAGDEAKKRKSPAKSGRVDTTALRGGEWYLKKRGSRKIWVGSRNIS